MPFPPRTAATDAFIRAIHNHLTTTGAPSGGTNRMMISAVTAGGTASLPSRVFIGFSGGVAGGTVRAVVTTMNTVPLFTATRTTILPFSGEGQLVAPLGGPVPIQLGHYQVAHNRRCSEPRALLEAARSGLRINGMSTMYWGNNQNPYPHPSGGIPNGVNGFTIFARPCDICSLNDDWLMTRVNSSRDTARGLPRRSVEAPL
ncbi:hypothetical protein [Flexibacterium corallicola]|uniref:hypothetical protein n=1 Tax=Flexibacterium corallicola TaxID=3037259 RepID=UPI00286F449D|nr:hypothetical protein [Pseudovibrio sp. M1P-2-3]